MSCVMRALYRLTLTSGGTITTARITATAARASQSFVCFRRPPCVSFVMFLNDIFN
jgi:hypothetical protein